MPEAPRRLRIGAHELAGPWMMAPMAGVSQMPFRLLVREMGASAAPTELISAKGLVFGQVRTTEYLRHDQRERPFWVQLFGAEPESMAIGAQHARELGAEIIDVNMGCPVRKVIQSGAGAALMKDPPRAAAIVRAIADRTGLPVTAKIRSGWDGGTINAEELTLALADAGCALVTIHARTRTQGYSGPADWAMIARLCEVSPIPVIGNGGVWCAADGHRMLDQTGCAGVMVGRGALGNPWIFRSLNEPSFRGPTHEERWRIVRRHLQDHLELCGDEQRGIKTFRPHLLWYSHGQAKAAAFRQSVLHIDDLGVLLQQAEEFFLAS
jgi:tRNA-dihydrouridine synthase B